MVGTTGLDQEQHRLHHRRQEQVVVDTSRREEEERLESESIASSASSIDIMQSSTSSLSSLPAKVQSPGGTSTASASASSDSGSSEISASPPNPLSLNTSMSSMNMSNSNILLNPDGSVMDEEEALRVRIRTQVEYYFSQQNLQRDTYMLSQMDTDGYIPVAKIGEFKQLMKLTGGSLDLIKESISGKTADGKVDENLKSTICELSEDGERIKASWKRPQRTTIILREVKEGTSEEDIKALLDDTEYTVQSVRSDVGQTWFVTMGTEADAKGALLHLIGKTLNGETIKARMKSETLPVPSPRVWTPNADAAAFNAQVPPYYGNYGVPQQQMQYNMMGYAAPRGQPNWNQGQYSGYGQNVEQQGNWSGDVGGKNMNHSNSRSPHGQQRRGGNSNNSHHQNQQAGQNQQANLARQGSSSSAGSGSRTFVSNQQAQGQQGQSHQTNVSNKANNRNNSKQQGDNHRTGTNNSSVSRHGNPNTGGRHADSGNRNQNRSRPQGQSSTSAGTKSSSGPSSGNKGSNVPPARKKGGNAPNNAGSGKNNAFVNKKIKTPVFKAQDFPSLPMGKLSLDDPAPVEGASEKTKATAPTTTAVKKVTEYANVAAKPASLPEAKTVKPVVAATKEKENADKVVVPKPAPKKEQAVVKPNVTTAPTKSLGSSWAAAVAKAAPISPVVNAAPAPTKTQATSKNQDASKAKPQVSKSPRQTGKSALPVAGTSKTSQSQVASSGQAVAAPAPVAAPVPRPKRGWEKPGLAPVTKLETKPAEPKADASAVASAEVKASASSAVKSSPKSSTKKVELEKKDEAVAGTDNEAPAETAGAENSKILKSAFGAWGTKKSFVDIIKTNAEVKPAEVKPNTSQTTSPKAASKTVGGKRPTNNKTERLERPASNLFGPKKGNDNKPRLSNIEGDWRQEAKKHSSKLNGRKV